MFDLRLAGWPWFALALAIAFVASTSQAGDARPATSPPNLVVVMVDDLGWQDVSVPMGPETTEFNRRYRTPNLERLADRGVVFTNAYAACPVCTPTRTAYLTGRHPARTGITYWTLHKDRDTSAKHPRLETPPWRLTGLDESDVTLPRLLRDAGYRTVHVGKAHFGAVGTPGADPTNLGFETNIAGHGPGGPGSFYGIHDFGSMKRDGKEGPSVWDVPGLEEFHGQDVYLTEVLAAKAAAEVMKSKDDPRPLYLNFAPYAVHAPIMANPRHLAPYEGLDPREAAYATMIESVDAALGTVLEALEDAGIAENTIVVFTSDNGGLSAHARGGKPHTHNAPLRSGKGSAYEGGVRIPMVVAGSPVSTLHADARRVDTPVTTTDLFPTLLEFADVSMPDGYAETVDATSLTGLLRKTAPSSPPSAERGLAWHMPHQWGAKGPGIEPFSSWRRGNWKLLYFHDGPRIELYDLAADLSETNDLAASHPELARALLLELDAWMAETGANLSIDRSTGEPVPRPAAFATTIRESPSAPASPE
ncbi:MAG: sulfatase [Phycisphaerales bacterium]